MKNQEAVFRSLQQDTELSNPGPTIYADSAMDSGPDFNTGYPAGEQMKELVMSDIAIKHAMTIFNAATSVIRIFGVGGKSWKRNVAKGARIGPWLQGNYEIVNEPAWRSKGACLYMVNANDSVIRYVGISRNGLKHRWRTSPAYDADTMVKLSENQLFHSQCWKHIEAESEAKPGSIFEVRAIGAETLVPILELIGAPLSAFAVFRDDGESVVAGVERWLCNNSNSQLLSWNVAMTGK